MQRSGIRGDMVQVFEGGLGWLMTKPGFRYTASRLPEMGPGNVGSAAANPYSDYLING